MSTIQDIRNQLATIATEAHKVARSLDVGDERTAASDLYEAFRRLQRHGAATDMLAATNPLLSHCCEDDDEDWWGDEDD